MSMFLLKNSGIAKQIITQIARVVLRKVLKMLLRFIK